MTNRPDRIPLPDGTARERIRGELDRTFLVEAAAGTGKTTELVARIVNTIASGRGRLGSIVAVTFTEKAAGEMKLRIRTELDRALQASDLDAAAQERLRAALAELEVAKISTIHALCAEMLRQHPVEAGVDPRFEVADAQRTRRLLERTFDTWFERALQAPPEGVARVLRRRAVDTKGETPRAQLLRAVECLVETRDFDALYRRPVFDRPATIEVTLSELSALAGLAHRAHSQSDPLRRSCQRLESALERARDLDCDGREAFLRQLLRDRDVFDTRTGRGAQYGPELPREAVLALRAQARANLERCVEQCGADLAACLSRELREVVAAYEAEKAAQGVLDFFDLLLAARKLLSQHDTVRAELQHNVSQVFVDEFQDTDPVQAEILLLLCADHPDERDPWRVRPVPGKLFLVGDPKQSIYRFRRADVSLYERIKAHLCSAGAELLQLVTSFRALPAIQSFINAAFEPAMAGEAHSGQAAYVPLCAFRPARAEQPTVIALPAPRPFGASGRVTKRAIDSHLPDAVAAWLEWLVQRSGYRVLEHGSEVPVRARHVCLLFRRFRGFDGDVTREYVRALEARRIPHVLSGGRSFHTREEVMALRAVLSALEWPDDALAVYATLRGPFAGFSDDVLLAFKTALGHLHPFGPVDAAQLATPELGEVAAVLELMRELHRCRNRRPIAQTLSGFLHGLRAHAGIAIWPSGEQALGNLLHVIEFARAYEARGEATSFRGFVDWLDEHAEAAAATDASVLEESSEGVRIMTVHAAKGLEFPVVVLCDPTAPRRVEHASRYIDPERRLWAQSLCGAEPIELREQRDLVRTHDEAEIVRLAYVAATRARELLVVPCCSEAPIEGWLSVLHPALYPAPERARTPLGNGPGCPRFGRDSVVDRADHIPDESVAPGEHIPLRGEHRAVWWDPNLLLLQRPPIGGFAEQELLSADGSGQRDGDGLLAYQAWSKARATALDHGNRPSLDAATMTQRAAAALQAATSPAATPPSLDVVDTAVDRTSRARGARFGTLVHALLAGLAPSEGDADLRRSAHYLGRTLAASATEIEHAIAAVTAARSHALWQRVERAATRGEVWRETPVVLRTQAGALLDGVVDLAFRERDAGAPHIVLVDFKTDAELEDLTVYAAQLQLYADALQRTTGQPVRQVLFRV